MLDMQILSSAIPPYKISHMFSLKINGIWCILYCVFLPFPIFPGSEHKKLTNQVSNIILHLSMSSLSGREISPMMSLAAQSPQMSNIVKV
jgi:hypothetical protein